MQLTPVARTSAADDVYDQLADRIVAGEIGPGDPLPSERALAETLGVSRPVVREAMKRLAQAGLVSIRHGGATTVSDFQRTAGPELLPRLLLDRDGNLDLAVARGIVETRSELGPLVASAAARNDGAATADRLDPVLERMAATNDVTELQRLALDFWDIVVDGSGNVVHRLLFNALRRAYEPVMEAITEVVRAEVADLAGYQAVTAALRDADPVAAAGAVRAVVDHGARATIEVIDLLLDDAEDDPTPNKETE